MEGGESGSEKKKGDFVPKEAWDKQKEEGRCIRCGRSSHQTRCFKCLSRAKTPPFFGNGKQEPVQKKRRLDSGHLKIMEIGSEVDLGNE